MIACIAEAWKVSLVNPILSWHVLLSGRTGTLEHRNTQKTRNTTYNPEHPPENPEYPQKTRNTPQKTRNTPQKIRNIFQNTKKSAKSLKPDRASMLQNKFLLRGTRMKLWVLKNVCFKCQISMGVPGFLGGVSGFLGVFWVFWGGVFQVFSRVFRVFWVFQDVPVFWCSWEYYIPPFLHPLHKLWYCELTHQLVISTPGFTLCCWRTKQNVLKILLTICCFMEGLKSQTWTALTLPDLTWSKELKRVNFYEWPVITCVKIINWT